jgi:putative ABC transport system permease protein
MLLKSPGFTVVAVLTLALGIGANTAIFSVINAVLLRPLPYPEPERLIAVWERDTRQPDDRGAISYPNFFDWRAQSQTLERIAVYRDTSFTLTGLETALHVRGAVVSPDLFPILGVKPHLGRWFTAEEEKPGGPGAPRAAIISHAMWHTRLGGDANILGRALTLDGRLFNVVGVMPAGFQFPIAADPADIWITTAADAQKDDDGPSMTEQRGAHFLQGMARLRPHVSPQQAQAEMDAIAARLEKQFPDTNSNAGVRLAPFQDDLVADYRLALWVLLGAVGCVLLIACANVANLLLARAVGRHREIAVRAALGANRWCLIRQLLTESTTLAVVGGALGLLFAWWGTEALVGLIPEDVPRLSEIALDRWVLGFTLLVSLVTGVTFGLAPAWHASKTDLTTAIKEGGRGAATGRRPGRLRGALVTVEIALSLVLLIGAGLLLRSFHSLQQVRLGFDPNQVLTASVNLPGRAYATPQSVSGFYDRLRQRAQRLPGVTAVSVIMPLPLSGNALAVAFEIEGRSVPPGNNPVSHFRTISPDYFKTMKIPVVQGRDFTAQDGWNDRPVAIVNERLVKEFFPDQNPLGRRIKPGITVGNEPPWREIIGVVKDVRHRPALSSPLEPELYVPHAQVPLSGMTLVVRAESQPSRLVNALQAEVSALDSTIPLYRVKTLGQYISTAVAHPKFYALVLGLFAGLALVLAIVGLYSVMAYSVAQQTTDIGIRIALGARPRDVLGLVLRQGLRLTLLGLGAGIAAAVASTRVLSSMLFGVTATDMGTYASISLLLAGVALVACFVPARRAARVDPLVALRYE